MRRAAYESLTLSGVAIDRGPAAAHVGGWKITWASWTRLEDGD